MKRNPSIALFLLAFCSTAPAQTEAPRYPSPREVRAAFLKLLDRPLTALDVRGEAPARGDDGLVSERLSFATERKADGSFERVPLLLVRPGETKGRLPVVIALHGTGGDKEGMRGWLNELARRGIIGVAIDARYHGQRAGGAKGAAAYIAAITRAWRAKPGDASEHPFYYDTCWDLWRTLDYLESRDDVDAKRIGMIGISMGGIETWLAAAADARVAVAVPAISVQSFRWSLENEQWQGRARTIAAAHDVAAKDLGEPQVNARVCRALWDKVIPGMLDQFDCPSMLRLLAGRPLLILNGELDPNCPLGGAERAIAAAKTAYAQASAPDRLKVSIAPGVGHAVTPEQHAQALAWFVRWLKP